MVDSKNEHGFESPINKPDKRSSGSAPNKGSKGGEFQSPVTSGDKSESSGHKNGSK